MAEEKKAGHAAHTQDAQERGLPGTMLRPIKVTMMGAGSGFTPRLTSDILNIPGNLGGTIALVDIDASRLHTMVGLLTRLVNRGRVHSPELAPRPHRMLYNAP